MPKFRFKKMLLCAEKSVLRGCFWSNFVLFLFNRRVVRLPNGHPFLFEQPALTFQLFTFALAMESAQRAIRGDDPVTGHQRSVGVVLQSLADGLSRAATDALTQGLVADGLTSRYIEQSQIDLTPERGKAGILHHAFPYICFHDSLLCSFSIC